MSAATGIELAHDLTAAFAAAIESQSVRFLKIVIQNELLTLDQSIPIQSSFEQDLNLLQDSAFVQDNHPTYILARLDEPPTEWLVIYYVPDTANVREKMLYAATRSSLLKSLGSTFFTDSLFATSRSDLTPEAYVSHRRSQTAPKPLSTREQELAHLRAAETPNYQGSRVRASHVGTGVGLKWSDEVTHAARELLGGTGPGVLIIEIDPSTEMLGLHSRSELDVDDLASALPPSQPCYALFAWPIAYRTSQRQIVFIYSCPPTSPIKHRMLYSSGSSSVYLAAKTLFSEVALSNYSQFASRKVETSDPKELTSTYLQTELGLDLDNSVTEVEVTNKKAFARPRGPARRRP